MGHNSSKWDADAHYASKTYLEIESELKHARESLDNISEESRVRMASFYSNWIGRLELERANRVGMKGVK